jgi:hypothetical protein
MPINFSPGQVWSEIKAGRFPKFMISREAIEVLQVAAAEAGPQNSTTPDEISALIASGKAKREALAKGPTNSAPDIRKPVSEAAKALLAAATAKAEAKLAAEKAKAAVAALPPAPTGPVLGTGKQEPMPDIPQGLSSIERRDWGRKHSTLSADTAKYFGDSDLMRSATHPYSDPATRPAAMKELNRRGWTYNEASQTWSQSQG